MANYRETNKYSGYLNSKTKRCFDLVVCVTLLLPTLVIVILLAVIILAFEGRPVFFIHRRVGKDGRLFAMPKIRTLRSSANPYEPSPKSEQDPSITLTGRFLRKHRLDELPQIFSVLTGQMSLVGPRPDLPNMVATYKPVHKKRFAAKPGITGLWQLMADHNVAMHKNIKYDLYYLRKATLWLDIKILVKTIPFVLRPESLKDNHENRVYISRVSVSK